MKRLFLVGLLAVQAILVCGSAWAGCEPARHVDISATTALTERSDGAWVGDTAQGCTITYRAVLRYCWGSNVNYHWYSSVSGTSGTSRSFTVSYQSLLRVGEDHIFLRAWEAGENPDQDSRTANAYVKVHLNPEYEVTSDKYEFGESVDAGCSVTNCRAPGTTISETVTTTQTCKMSNVVHCSISGQEGALSAEMGVDTSSEYGWDIGKTIEIKDVAYGTCVWIEWRPRIHVRKGSIVNFRCDGMKTVTGTFEIREYAGNDVVVRQMNVDCSRSS